MYKGLSDAQPEGVIRQADRTQVSADTGAGLHRQAPNDVMSSDQLHERSVVRQSVIVGEQNHRFAKRLGDEHSVKRVFVVRR